MPEDGIYIELPRPASIRTLIAYLEDSPVVKEVKKEGKQVIHITKENGNTLKIYLTNLYIVGEADVTDIMARIPNLNGIVTMSAWNSYSQEAKDLCKEKNVGLFLFKEVLGAVYYDGKKFLDYKTPKKTRGR